MSGGVNKLFKQDPQQFLATHFFASDSKLSVAPGVIRVNLAVAGTMNQNTVYAVNRQLGNGNTFSNAFDAYYLPWRQGERKQLQLGNAAKYFFTPALTGCRFIIGAGATPLVEHVDGGRYTDQQMDAMCNVRSNGHNQGAHRYWDNGAWYASVVVGVRTNNGWRFYAQNYNYNSGLPINTNEV